MHAMIARPARRFLGIAALAVATVVLAGTTYTDFLKALGQRESSMDTSAVNRDTKYVGLYQMGELSLQDAGVYAGDGTKKNDYTGNFTGKYGVNSLSDFLADPEAQTQAITSYHNLVWNNYLTNGGRGGAADYIGQTINGIEITQSGLIAAAHLVGHGKVTQWLASGGATDPQDQNATKMTEYLQRFAGYGLSPIAPSFAAVAAATPTGGASAIVAGNGSSYTYTAPPLVDGGSAVSGPNAPVAPKYGSAQQGFKAGAGYSMGQVRDFIVSLIAAGLFLWLGAITLKSFGGYTAGNVAIYDMGQIIMRAVLVVLIFVVILQ